MWNLRAEAIPPAPEVPEKDAVDVLRLEGRLPRKFLRRLKTPGFPEDSASLS
jgi:hypothetical protein